MLPYTDILRIDKLFLAVCAFSFTTDINEYFSLKCEYHDIAFFQRLAEIVDCI